MTVSFTNMPKKNLETFATHLIGLIDLVIAFVVIGVVSFQFAKGASLLTGLTSYKEKLARLSFYAMFIYIFLLIHVVMSIQLYRSAGKIVERPIYAIKCFGRWKEWSIVYTMAILLHAMFVFMLMEDGQRKQISLVCSLAHASVRPIGIILIRRFKSNLEANLPAQRSIKFVNSNP